MVRALKFCVIFCAIFFVGCISADEEEEEMPDHFFDIKEVIQKSGKNKGAVKFMVKLFIPPYLFKKRKSYPNGNTDFSCGGCDMLKSYVKATAITYDEGRSYELLSLPNSHVCAPSGTAHLVARCMSEIKSKILEAPTEKITCLFEESKLRYSENLSMDERITFNSEFPDFCSVKSHLYRLRRDIIPPAPNSQVDFDLTSSWFHLSDGKSSVLGNKIIGHKNIVVFSTVEHLEYLCRARTISGDGTFKITPHLWYQTFILCCEIVPGSWIPAVFGLLPDKQR